MTTILVVNCGSRSIRLAAYRVDASGINVIARAHADDLHGEQATTTMLERLPVPDVVAHRLVHGGDWLIGPCWYRPEQQAQLDALDALAPLHNPKTRRWLANTQQRWPEALQALVPDTGFFHQLPAVAKHLPLPKAISERFQLRRYGFHGLAHQALWRALRDARPDLAAGRVITLQLGGGCSAAALKAGVPLDTSMGFTPLSGLMMSTRPGDLDPGVILRLLTELSAADVSTLLNQQSGLLGVSGLSADMRSLLACDNAEAAFAIESFCYRVRHYLGAYAAVLGGIARLLREEVGTCFLPWADANAKAVVAGAPTFTVKIDGVDFSQETQKYHAKSLAEIRRKYALVSGNTALNAVLADSDCLRWLAS